MVIKAKTIGGKGGTEGGDHLHVSLDVVVRRTHE